MHFRLFYRGPLKPNGSAADKQFLRRYFHRQLKELWAQPPLSEISGRLNFYPAKGEALGISRGNYLCVPLVSERLELVASLEITMLRPGAPGRAITPAGDIDNRLKTLLDSLQVPKPNQITDSDAPTDDENPFFYCLVEDDSLITGIDITTDRLLLHPADASEVLLLIHVRLEFTHQHFTNLVPSPSLLTDAKMKRSTKS